ncbi:hypothetical protein AEAC466_19265 [Asticcacaulis sp. AC466]|uniref:hypothetical protein n=1 Tax=Asticcacaulis sp. AC466 TaxID=1282362 RepID=UPI0003C3C30B|nr:hypothetical protein [Asticcacaulis sp. AC466]ESQ82060.1 hypothetical protein AEAC466_19265 [Asticcacaulis sp. AC466]
MNIRAATICSFACSFAVLLFTAPHAFAAGWTLSPPHDGHLVQLSLGAPEAPTYLFSCTPSNVRITYFGATELLDIQTGQKIDDAPGATITPGASVMALYTGKGSPDFMAAEAVANATKGWNLTITLAKDDKQLRQIEKSKMLSLFTTGTTMAVELSSDDRALVRDFLKQCSAT